MTETITMQPGVVARLPLDVVDFDPDQPRKDIDLAYIAELAADIRDRGVLQPITVRAGAEAGRYIIKYGECRYRASRQAEKATIPALLDTEEQHGDQLSRLLDQVKENHLRRGLNPMEWAGVLLRMRNDHKIKSMAKIEDTLREHGITNMGRSYISNMMRLLELPEWAQDLIRDGKLTAAHGKYLLPATAAEKVIEHARSEIAEREEMPTVRKLQNTVFAGFQRYQPRLDQTYDMHFDYRVECVNAGCQKMRKAANSYGCSATFCLDRSCFNEKQAEGERRAQQPPSQERMIPIVNAEGIVDTTEQRGLIFELLRRANFSKRECMTCKDRHDAIVDRFGNKEQHEACFEPSCYKTKTDAWKKISARQMLMDDVLEKWLVGRISCHLQNDPDAQIAVVTMAALASTYSFNEFSFELSDIQKNLRQALSIKQVTDLLQGLASQYRPVIASKLLDAADMQLLMPLAKHFGITVDDYRIEDAYLETLDDAGLQQLIIDNAHCWPESSDEDLRQTAANLDGTELIDLLIGKADQINTPEEIRQAWLRAVDEETEAQTESEEEAA